jgi:hypothetical protein
MHSHKPPTTKTTSSSSQKRQSTESQPELLQVPPKHQKQTHKWKREKNNWNFLLTKQAKNPQRLDDEGSSSFLLLLLQKTTNKKEKKTTQNKFTQESKLLSRQLRVQETKHLWENTKLGGDEN